MEMTFKRKANLRWKNPVRKSKVVKNQMHLKKRRR